MHRFVNAELVNESWRVLAVVENDDSVAGRARGQSMRAGEETRKERSQFGEPVNDCQSPNAAGHVSVSSSPAPGWR
ncbi:hypothetical protein K0M31_011265 [Melipona bicolor]|uniref:Uncharacterized protein n=1 Tax=Melipona bicolor TaxID=60889 RepID=A0AA40G976_9HYME|nr:hypothetical protein K0M31_011265 [Melipona bicolor]